MKRETLRGGALRLSGNTCAFVYQRLSPGVFLTVSRGRDTGEFGTAPLDVIEREYKLFQRAVEWFFDATQVETATRAVSEDWTAWLRKHREVLAQMHILTSSEETHLMIGVARHFSDTSNRLILYTDRTEWKKAILRSASDPSVATDLAARLDEAPIAVTRAQTPEQGTTVSAANCSWSFRTIPNDVIFSRFVGDDSGDLTDAALDEMERLLSASGRKLSWFLDLRDARNVAPNVSQTWTEWLSGRQNRFARVTALAMSPLFPLVLTVARYRSGMEHLVRIHRDLEPFRRELVTATSGAIARSVGV